MPGVRVYSHKHFAHSIRGFADHRLAVAYGLNPEAKAVYSSVQPHCDVGCYIHAMDEHNLSMIDPWTGEDRNLLVPCMALGHVPCIHARMRMVHILGTLKTPENIAPGCAA